MMQSALKLKKTFQQENNISLENKMFKKQQQQQKHFINLFFINNLAFRHILK